MSEYIHLTKPAIEKLRTAFRGQSRVSTADLLERLEAMGYKSRNYRYNILSDAFALGMVQRFDNNGGPGYVYMLTPDWVLPALAVARTSRMPVADPSRMGRPLRVEPTPATAYEGPVFARCSLTPSVGSAFASHTDADGEVTPYHGAQIVDALHRQFDSMFRNVE